MLTAVSFFQIGTHHHGLSLFFESIEEHAIVRNKPQFLCRSRRSYHSVLDGNHDHLAHDDDDDDGDDRFHGQDNDLNPPSPRYKMSKMTFKGIF